MNFDESVKSDNVRIDPTSLHLLKKLVYFLNPKSSLEIEADMADAYFRCISQVLHDRFSHNLVHNRVNGIINLPTRFRRERSFPFFRHGVFLTHWFVF